MIAPRVEWSDANVNPNQPKERKNELKQIFDQFYLLLSRYHQCWAQATDRENKKWVQKNWFSKLTVVSSEYSQCWIELTKRKKWTE